MPILRAMVLPLLYCLAAASVGAEDDVAAGEATSDRSRLKIVVNRAE
jgi:hypothetical protein